MFGPLQRAHVGLLACTVILEGKWKEFYDCPWLAGFLFIFVFVPKPEGPWLSISNILKLLSVTPHIDLSHKAASFGKREN